MNEQRLVGTDWESLTIRGLRILNNRPAPMIFSEQPTARLNWFASSNAGGRSKGWEGLKAVLVGAAINEAIGTVFLGK